jgi:hypothetical protein
MSYTQFLDRKSHIGNDGGFDPDYMPDFLFDFQRALVEWSCRKGRSAILADCGLGKTAMQLVWANNVVRKTNRPLLILTPLAVSTQTVREANKFGIEATRLQHGGLSGAGIYVTNYERLHLFDPADFAGVVCDESSILKSYSGATRKLLTRFLTKIDYRLLCTATASPNDYVELGTSSEALGELSYSDMLRRFFAQLDDKGQTRELKKQEEAERIIAANPNYFKKLSFRVSQNIGQWRLKHHAVIPFWQWVCSWARACRKPSDLGYSDNGFILPELRERHHMIMPTTPPDGMLFCLPAFGLREERDERRRTLAQRVEFVAQLVHHDRPAVVWCPMNDEGKALARAIPDAREISGATPDDEKETIYRDFAAERLRVLIIKPKIGAWGLNWQHCAHVVTFASHSYEQFYQSVRRCWRFGQRNPVRLDIVATEGERGVFENMLRKAERADRMFEALVRHMGEGMHIRREEKDINKTEVPTWL